MNIALIDLGSNSARMYIISLENMAYSYISRHRVMTRLSEGMGKDLLLREAPILRTIKVLKEFAQIIKENNATPIAVATAAVRKAKNGAAFCRRVLEETGIDIKVISGETEAFLDFEGVISSLPSLEDFIIVDTGGGSTELILVKEKRLVEKTSLPFGAVGLFEDYSHLNCAKKAVLEELNQVDFLKSLKNIPLVGVGGSLCSLCSIDTILNPTTQARDVHGYVIPAKRLAELYESLAIMTPNQRIEKFGVEKGRADTICAGILPALALSQVVSSPKVILCTSGLREGIISRLLSGKEPL